MVHVIICDDDRAFLQSLCSRCEAVLSEKGRKAKLFSYTEMENIPPSVLSICDIALLDIDFAGKAYNGIDIARRIREQCKDAVIIFVTHYIEYAPEGYEVSAFRYVLKSEISSKLPLYLSEALLKLQKEREALIIRNGGEQIHVSLAEILYMESRQHTVTIRTQRREYRCYKSLTALEEELQNKGFLRIHNSFLVNMAHLTKYSSTEAVLSDGTALRVSARSYAEKKQEYLLWKGKT